MKIRGFTLDRPLPRSFQILLLVIAGWIPTCYVLKHYDPGTQLTSLILFGERLRAREVPAVRAMKPAVESPDGYDGQYYAQVALDPLLKKQETKQALDLPHYRAQRILLPVLAHLAGLGRPGPVIQAYALLNLAFWFLLLFGMAHYLRAGTARDYLCIFAAVFTTGIMMSFQRSLADLPAATLGFYGAALGGALAAGSVSLAMLAKETSLLFLFRFAWPPPKTAAAALAIAGRCLLIAAPMACWMFYVRHVFGGGPHGIGAFGWPLHGWAGYIAENWRAFIRTDFHLSLKYSSGWEWRLFEMGAALSSMYQACFLAIRRRPDCPYWRTGIAFAVMFLFFTSHVFEEEIGFCRSMLPVAIAFNIGLMQQRGRLFTLNFLAGNIGLFWGVRNTLSCCLSRNF
jgi:hypothetical protein